MARNLSKCYIIMIEIICYVKIDVLVLAANKSEISPRPATSFCSDPVIMQP